ncbi:TPA: AAA family ATPase [Photobacterium damselae]
MEYADSVSQLDHHVKQFERTILVTIEKEYHSERGSHLGKLNAHFEVFPDGEIYPINTGTDFCDTEQVFLISGFQEIKEKYGRNLFQAICSPSKADILKDRDCKYVTWAEKCSDIKQIFACQTFNTKLPELNSILDPKIIVDKLPITNTVMIFDEQEDCYLGPFAYRVDESNDSEESAITLKALQPTLSNTIPPYHVGKYDRELLETYCRNLPDGTQLISNIKRIADRHIGIIDFISDEEIIGLYASKVVNNGAIRNFSKGTVSHIRKYLSTTKDYSYFPKRFERLFGTLEKVEAWKDTRSDMMQLFLQSESGKKILTEYIRENKDQYFEQERVEFKEKLQKSFESENNNLASIKAERDELVSDIRRLTEEHTKLQRGDLENKHTENDYETWSKEHQTKIDAENEKLVSIQDNIKTVEEKLSNLKKTYVKYQNLEELEKEIQFQETLKQRTQSQLTETQAKLKESNDALIKKLVSLKPDVDALCGIIDSRPQQHLDLTVPIIKIEGDKQVKQEKIITGVIEHLEGYGRTTDFHAAANLLTSVAQTQFTLFSGLPGTGKTSMAKLLGQSLGLKSRCLTIPVARGWTSVRDILGFYNSLSQSYVNAPNGFTELLKQLDKEKREKLTGAPALVILDEFNLSQPEHYFSSFMEMADSELSQRTITTGDPNHPNILVPEHLRFIGTINNDESVQSLTPRMLDRACVVNFDDLDLDRSDNLTIPQTSEPEELLGAISGIEFIKLFKADTYNLTDNIRSILSLIIEKLSINDPKLGAPISISMRKIKAIAAYQNVAGSLMYEKPLGALDYAVSQHILPLLNGYGENFGRRLEELKLVIPESMERTHSLLGRIITNGEANMHSYGMGL